MVIYKRFIAFFDAFIASNSEVVRSFALVPIYSFRTIGAISLAIHSAKYPNNVKLSQEDRVKLMGYGIPEDVNNILFNSDHEITLIQSDRLIKGSYMEILEFPFPESLVDEHGYFYGNIAITLVTAPVLFPGNGSEYCQSNIDVLFGTFDEIEAKEINRVNKNAYGPDGFENLLLPEKYRSRFINADHDNPFTREGFNNLMAKTWKKRITSPKRLMDGKVNLKMGNEHLL